MVRAQHMQSLPYVFAGIPDPRRARGRRHALRRVPALCAGAVLCGMRGYKAMHDRAQGLGQKARERFGCRYEHGHYVMRSLHALRDVLVRVEAVHLDRALKRWNETYAAEDESLAMDGKTMGNAIDDEERPIHIMSAVGHTTKTCCTPKESVPCP